MNKQIFYLNMNWLVCVEKEKKILTEMTTHLVIRIEFHTIYCSNILKNQRSMLSIKITRKTNVIIFICVIIVAFSCGQMTKQKRKIRTWKWRKQTI